MIRASIIIFFLFLSLFLEVTIVTIPLVFMTLVVWYCFTRSDWSFVAAILCGIFLDMLLVKQIGLSSMFFIFLLFCIFLYQKKFEIDSYYFIGTILFGGTALYLLLFGYAHSIILGIITACLGTGIFFILEIVKKKKECIRV